MLRSCMLMVGLSFLCISMNATATLTKLQTEYMSNPMGIDVPKPRFSWAMSDDNYGAGQTAYRLVVSSSLEQLKKSSYLFDTGKVLSSISVGIRYNGEALRPSTRYFWKVIVWNEKGQEIESDPEWFETGLLGKDWSDAQWIGSSKYQLSKYKASYVLDYDFQISKKGNTATFITGAKNQADYLFFSVSIDKKKGSKLIIGHRWKNVPTTDFTEDISSVIPFDAKEKVHHMKVIVNGPASYNLHFNIDGQNIQCSTKPDTKDAYKFHIAAFSDNTVIQDCRLYNIGFVQSKENEAVFSNILISDNRWNDPLYTDSGMNHSTPGQELTLWQPGSDASAPMLRKTVRIDKPLKQARLYSTARGLYDFYINGQRVGNDFLNPGWTDYRYRIMYNTYDVTSLMTEGNNALGAILGEGWFSGDIGWGGEWNNQYGIRQSLLAKIVLEFTDGTKQTIVSDGTWKCYDNGPVVSNSLYQGEDYNATKEITNWCIADFNDNNWQNATIIAPPAQTVNLQAYVGSTIQNNLTLTACTVNKVGKSFVYDMGQNMVGIPRLSGMKGKAGQQVTVHYAEMLYPDVIPEIPVPPYTKEEYIAKKGQLYMDNYRSALSTDHYIMKGDKAGETFEPRFTSHGFRYLSIEGLDEPLPLASVQGLVTESIGKQTSSYETSNADINKLFNNIVWGQRGNFLSVPTDCPQRDERLGWTGDAQIFSRSATYNMNVDPFYTRWFFTVRDNQADNGDFGGYYPQLGIPPYGSIRKATARSGGWSDVGIIVPWQVYQQYGDLGMVESQYESMCHYMNFLERNATQYIQPGGGFGDWVAPVPTDMSLINTAFSAYDAQLMEKMALALGKKEDAQRFAKFYDNIKNAFNKTFVDAEGYTFAQGKTGSQRINTQTSYILPLQFGLFTDEVRPMAWKHFLETIEASGTKLTTGFLGTPYICTILSENGKSDIAYKLFLQTEYPSWLFPVKQGATTMWERWNSYTVKNGFGPVSMNSFNHYSYGAIEEWIMAHSLGIQRDETNPGYKRILLQPEFNQELDYAKGGFESMYGPIQSNWEKNPEGYRYMVTIPANTTASLVLDINNVKNMSVLKGKEGVVSTKPYNGKIKCELKSGSYEFIIKK